MTRLRKMMLEELQRRNYSQNTVRAYLHSVQAFAEHFHASPDRLGLEHIRTWQAHLFHEKQLSASSVARETAALRFFFVRTLRRSYPVDAVPYPKRPRRLPTILTPDETARLINSASNLFHRALLMTLYATGMRRSEVCNLKVSDIDGARMIVHVRNGKGGRDRDIPLDPKLRETLQEYWRWMRPNTYPFPGTVKGWRADKPIDAKVVWLTWFHLRVLFAIEHCRTAALGGHLDRCRQCGHEATSFNSCRSRHCPDPDRRETETLSRIS